MPPPRPQRRWTRWLPALYLAFGLAWILASDQVVGWLFADRPHLLLVASTLKGFAFVALTALMLAVWWRAEQRHGATQIASAEARADLATRRMAWMSRHAHDVILLLDDTGRILDCNERAEQVYGYARDDLLAMRIFDLRNSTDVSFGEEQFKTLVERGGLVYHTQHRRRDGSIFPVEVSASVVDFQERRYVQSIGRDQSELVAARLRTERQRDLYDMLSRCNHVVARVHDRASLFTHITRLAVEHGHFLFAWLAELQDDGSVRKAASFGRDGGYVDQLRVSARHDDPEGRGPTGRCLRNGVTVVVNRFLDDPTTSPWHAIAARVGVRSVAAVPIRLRGEVVAALVVYNSEVDFFDTDVVPTLEELCAEIGFGLEALEVRRELYESRNLLQTVIDASGTPIQVFDREGRALLMNEAGARVMGAPRAEVIGQRRRGMSEADALAHRASDLRVFETGETLYVEETVGSGEAQRVFLSVKFPLRDLQGRIHAVGGVSTDITEQRRSRLEIVENNLRLEQTVAQRTRELVEARDRAEQADRAKTAFLSTISHELRTPLNSILGFTDIVLQEFTGPLNEEQRRQLSIVHDSAKMLLDLINEILDLSRIEAGRLQFSIEPFDVADLLRRRVDALASQAAGKGLQLVCDVDPRVRSMTSDAKRVAQIVSNLLSNAVKFTPSGTVTLRARLHEDRVRISVRDTGPGIAPEDMARLFRPFMQGGDTHAHHGEGTGLGLVISRHLARALGGDIEVTSAPGLGATFTVELPLETEERLDPTGDSGLFKRLTIAR